MAIQREKCRAKILIEGTSVGGSNITVRTPFVQSFNVNKSRGSASTFDASLKVPSSDISGSIGGAYLDIFAGSITGYDSVDGSLSGLPRIFRGYIRQAKISPCYDDPDYVILSISGSDALSLLQGKKYTRRCRSTQASFVSITGVTRRGLKGGKFTYQAEDVLELDDGLQDRNLSVTETRKVADQRKGRDAPKDTRKLVAPLIVTPVEG
jgi:hypothetical protein